MTSFASAAVVLYFQATKAVVDTIVVRDAAQRGLFEKVTGVASGIMTLTLLVMAVALVPAAWNFRKTYKKTATLLDKIQADVAPLVKHAHSIADNVDYVSTAIRSDVAQIQSTLAAANERIQQAIVVTERRINEFNALMDVVQEEAEGVFVSTAATVRGVRAGASHFASDTGPELASVEVDDNGTEAELNDEEMEYDDDYDGESGDQSDPSRAPRIIRRTRTRG